MNRFLIFFSLQVLLTSFSVGGQPIRGLYVNRVDSILGNAEAEQDLLHYLSYGQFNSISFYSMYRLNLADPEIREKLRSLIRRARDEYGVHRFGAVSESLSGFIENIHLYNQDSLTRREDRLDHYNLEFEFWSDRATSGYYCTRYLEPNGYSCDPDGAFAFVSQFIRELKEQTKDIGGIELEMYVGWLRDDHAAALATMVDRILYAVYREMDEEGNVNLYDFPAQRKRLEDLGRSGTIRLAPIFTSFDQTSDHNLASWLGAGHTVCEAWDLYFSGFQADKLLANKKNLKIDGYQWFKYSSMPPIPLTLQTPGPILGPERAQTNEEVRYTIPPDPQADYYEWSLYQSGKNFRHLTENNAIATRFEAPGRVYIQVRSVGCGAVSPPARITLFISPKDTLLTDESQDFEIRVVAHGLHLVIPANKQGPFHIEAINMMGTRYIRKTLDEPGTYYLKFKHIPDSSHFLNISIIHPGGSFSKKFSIFDHQEK